MRIIAGDFKGRKLTDLSGMSIRPTSDRVREAIYNILGPKIHDTRILDLFAGSGALGLEGLSRGAQECLFIDKNTQFLNTNIERCRVEKKASVIQTDIASKAFVQLLAGRQFDIIFMDPPYLENLIETVLNLEGFTDLLDKKTTIIAEHSYKESVTFLPDTLDIYRQKKYSKTIISFIGRKL